MLETCVTHLMSLFQTALFLNYFFHLCNFCGHVLLKFYSMLFLYQYFKFPLVEVNEYFIFFIQADKNVTDFLLQKKS